MASQAATQAAQAALDAIQNLGKSGDARFFQTTKKGEVMELKTDLNSLNKDKVKDAVKKVIASMTVGKDVSSLFTDVVKSMQTDNIELKKLVYLYIINYARSQPDKAILIVNTFQKGTHTQPFSERPPSHILFPLLSPHISLRLTSRLCFRCLLTSVRFPPLPPFRAQHHARGCDSMRRRR